LDGAAIGTASGPGNLQLRRGVTILDKKRFDVLVGGSATATPGQNSFPTKTHVFTYLDAGAPANPTYSVWGLANNAFASAEVKILVINNPPTIPASTNPSSPGPSGTVALAAAQTTIQTQPTNLPAGNNVIVAAVQLYEYAGRFNDTIAAGNLRITRTGGATLTSNQFVIDFDAGAPPEWVTSDKGFLLVAQDVGAPANATYNVTAQASAAAGIYGQANMVVMQGIPSAYIDGASIPVTAAATTLATLNTTYPQLRSGSDNLALVSTQYSRTDANPTARFVNPPVTGENLLFGGAVQASNAFQTEICSTVASSGTFCTEFSAGLLWQQNTSTSSPSFLLRSQANNTGINADAKILGLHMEPVADLVEIYP
jgi:hypothetical protein